MSDEELKEEFGLGDEPEEESTEEEQQEEEEQPEEEGSTESQPEEDDLPPGYMTKEEWVAKGKDPDEWRSPEVFKERGYWLKRQAQEREEFDRRIENLSAYHRTQLEMQRDDLIRKRDDAIEMADKNEVKRLDKQLDSLGQQEKLISKKDAPNTPIEVQQWEEQNPWVKDPNDERTPIAQSLFQRKLKSNGGDVASALESVDEAMEKLYPPKTNKRPPPVEKSAARSAGKGKNGVDFSSITAEEKKIWESGLFGDDKKAFLQAVADDRKGAKS